MARRYVRAIRVSWDQLAFYGLALMLAAAALACLSLNSR